MKYLQRLESGDKIFLIDNENRIREIELLPKHFKDQDERHAIVGNYHLKSDIIESGGDVRLEKVTVYEEIDDHFIKQRRLKREDTDKVAYLSFDDAQAHLNDMSRQRSAVIELQEDANRELESHLTAIKSILSNYFDRLDRHDIDNALLKDNEEHNRLLELRELIS